MADWPAYTKRESQEKRTKNFWAKKQDGIADERARYTEFHRAAYGCEAPEDEITDERMAELRSRRMRKRIAAAHQEAEHAG